MNTNAQQYRHEFKYVVSAAQIPLLRSRISCFMSPDPHTGSAGDYEIRSLYFDDYHNRCFYENENGTDPREKFRIRIYNHSDSRITLECKRKEHGKTLKTACSLLPEQTESLMRNLPLPEAEPVSPLLRRAGLPSSSEAGSAAADGADASRGDCGLCSSAFRVCGWERARHFRHGHFLCHSRSGVVFLTGAACPACSAPGLPPDGGQV